MQSSDSGRFHLSEYRVNQELTREPDARGHGSTACGENHASLCAIST
jgi:hypothetical protein